MRMRRVFIICCFFIFSVYADAQNTLSSADDLGRIALVPVIADNSNVPPYASTIVKDKLVQIVTRNGLGGNSYEQRFVITANLIEVSKEMTRTAPALVAVSLQPTLYIGDLETGTLFASCPLGIHNGVGSTEAKAYLGAVKTIPTNSSEITHFIEIGKERIIQYYNSQIDFILSKAQSLSDQEQYNEAISLLFTVPDVCKAAYIQAMDLTAVIYQLKIDKESAFLLNEANQIWNASQSYEGAEVAASYLSRIHPWSSSFSDASALSEAIAARVKELDDREWTFKMKQYEDQNEMINKQMENTHDEKLKLINAAREVGIAKANQPVTNNYMRVAWW